jgi:hypothetical protein
MSVMHETTSTSITSPESAQDAIEEEPTRQEKVI